MSYRVTTWDSLPVARQGHIAKSPGTIRAKKLMADGQPRTKAMIAIESNCTVGDAHNAVRFMRRLGGGVYQAIAAPETAIPGRIVPSR